MRTLKEAKQARSDRRAERNKKREEEGLPPISSVTSLGQRKIDNKFLAEQSGEVKEKRNAFEELRQRRANKKTKEMKEGGKVRGSGIAERGVRKAKML
jgi:hypothetical protein|tara:strand:+ start:15 stop:308 length:294 start_codon:yes stop_codon:yes gene_type:complete